MQRKKLKHDAYIAIEISLGTLILRNNFDRKLSIELFQGILYIYKK